MKFLYLIECFDIDTWKLYHPDPCLFETEKEADRFCESIEDEYQGTIICSYKKVRIG
jgi:hypothetical protein